MNNKYHDPVEVICILSSLLKADIVLSLFELNFICNITHILIYVGKLNNNFYYFVSYRRKEQFFQTFGPK